MDEAAKVLERLRRIRELDEGRAAPALVLDELRKLVSEAEGWARVEGDARARAAAVELGDAVRQVECSEGVIDPRVAVG
jgi:hypothetical protein